jgi:hypothetical protein
MPSAKYASAVSLPMMVSGSTAIEFKLSDAATVFAGIARCRVASHVPSIASASDRCDRERP